MINKEATLAVASKFFRVFGLETDQSDLELLKNIVNRVVKDQEESRVLERDSLHDLGGDGTRLMEEIVAVFLWERWGVNLPKFLEESIKPIELLRDRGILGKERDLVVKKLYRELFASINKKRIPESEGVNPVGRR